jgi:putative ABC transport system substrate-binding protein
VDVIVTATTAGTRAAMRATTKIPIVMAASADPVAAGLVASLNRPGGNVTGLSLQTTDIARKRLQLLREIVPGAATIALLAERVTAPTQGTTGILVAETQAAARQAAVGLVVREIARPDELADAFAQFRREQARALVVQVSPLLIEHRAAIVEMAARERLPAMYEARNFVDDGGLVSYGPDLRDAYRRAAAFVDRILKGTRPGDLPVEQPNRLALLINLKTAKSLGLAIPPSLLSRADEVIQ